MEDGRLDCIRRKLLTKGFTSDVFNLLVSKFKVPSETRGTLHTYQTTWEKFTAYCESRSLDRDAMEVTSIANFIAMEYKQGALGSKVDAHITALDMTRRFLLEESTPLGQLQIFKDLRKAAKTRRPPPRNAKPPTYFDPARIYLHISMQGKTKILKSADLRQKVEMLMVLDAAARGSDLHKVCDELITWEGKEVTVQAFWTKEEKVARLTPFTFRCSCEVMVNACTACTIREYQNRPRVKKRRKEAKGFKISATDTRLYKPFLVSHRGKAASISICTIRKDLQMMMTRAGIDPVWTPHDLRGAVASKLINLQAGEERVIQLGRWKSKKTMEKHYFRKTFYIQASRKNEKVALWQLLRETVNKVDEKTLRRIEEELPSEEEESGSHVGSGKKQDSA